MGLFSWVTDSITAFKVVGALDKAIGQFPNIDKKLIDTLLKNKEHWSKEYDIVKKRVIDGYDKKLNAGNVNELGEKYLDFFRVLFPNETGDEILSKVNIHKIENVAQKKIDQKDLLTPDDTQELVQLSQQLKVADYDSIDKIKNKFEYFITNWELYNGQFPSYEPDFILQKNEKCIYKRHSVELLERKQVTKKVNYAGPRMRIKIAKGLSYNLGSYNVGVEKQTVNLSRGTGTLNLTTKRILFKSYEKNVTITLKSIVDIEPYSDAIMISKGTGNPMYFMVPDGLKFYQYLNAAIRQQ